MRKTMISKRLRDAAVGDSKIDKETRQRFKDTFDQINTDLPSSSHVYLEAELPALK